MVLAALAGVAAPAAAQDFPSRPVTMIIPFAAGGPTDVLGRIMGARMSEVLGQHVVIENVGGAGGMTGAARVAQSAPDGYTIGLGTVGTHAQGQSLYKKPLYNAATDFTPVALIAAMGTGITHVPYRGTGPAMQDLQGGRIDFLCEVVSTAKPQIDGNTVKAIAILTKQRSPALPDVPTAVEQGLPDVEAYTWNAIFLPKGAPDAIVKKLHDATLAAMHTPGVKERLEGLGAMIVPDDRATPQYLGNFVKSEIEKWAAPIKASGASAD